MAGAAYRSLQEPESGNERSTGQKTCYLWFHNVPQLFSGYGVWCLIFSSAPKCACRDEGVNPDSSGPYHGCQFTFQQFAAAVQPDPCRGYSALCRCHAVLIQTTTGIITCILSQSWQNKIMNEAVFVDYYEILQVHPGCDRSILDGAYRTLAKQYHPDHPETANAERFQLVIDAYNVLKRAEKRAEYDRIHASRRKGSGFEQESDRGFGRDGQVAASDGYLQQNILLALYKQRRNNAREPGMNAFQLQSSFKCSDDNFEFHIWYLKSKGFVTFDEQGMLAITIEGVDHVISTHQHEAKEKLLLEQAAAPDD